MQAQKTTLTQRTMPYLDLGFLASRTVKKTNFCCLSYPICSSLLWQPWLTNAEQEGNLEIVPPDIFESQRSLSIKGIVPSPRPHADLEGSGFRLGPNKAHSQARTSHDTQKF